MKYTRILPVASKHPPNGRCRGVGPNQEGHRERDQTPREIPGSPIACDAEDEATPSGKRPLLLTLPEAAWELRLERRFLDRAIEKKQVRVVYFGRAKRIHREEIERLAREGLPPSAASRPKGAKYMKSNNS